MFIEVLKSQPIISPKLPSKFKCILSINRNSNRILLIGQYRGSEDGKKFGFEEI